jgi:pyruvate,orthophosphate dikinase
MTKKWVYLFNELDQAESHMDNDWDKVRGLLGGKGANLAEMERIGVPVPPGFTVTTEACNAYLAAKSVFSDEIWDQEIAALRHIEAETGKSFGSTENPLLVSCRSGAKFSMPGMMDTVLNIGLNDETAAAMAQADRRRTFCLRCLSPFDPDVRHGGHGHGGRYFRRSHHLFTDKAGVERGCRPDRRRLERGD